MASSKTNANLSVCGEEFTKLMTPRRSLNTKNSRHYVAMDDLEYRENSSTPSCRHQVTLSDSPDVFYTPQVSYHSLFCIT